MKSAHDVAEERVRELKDVLIQVLGADSVMNIGQIMNGLNRVSVWKKKMKEDMVSFNREIVEGILGEMVRGGKMFHSGIGTFTQFNHCRGLCHCLNGRKICLCCGNIAEQEIGWNKAIREKPLVYCPRCEKFNPILEPAVAKMS